MSGSPIPRLITSIPASRLAATLRWSSANMYGGIASSRLEGSVSAIRGREATGAAAQPRPRYCPRLPCD